MTRPEINALCARLIAYRDTVSDPATRDLLADVCGALDDFAKAGGAIDAARKLATRVHLYVGRREEIDEFMDCDIELSDLASAVLGALKTEAGA